MPARPIRPVLPIVVAAAFLLLGALSWRVALAGGDTAAAPYEFVVTASDFAFAAPRTVPAGLVRVRLRNHGSTFHHVQLVRLAPGHSYAEYLERLQARDFGVPWATFVGGPDSPEPGADAEATLLLTEGEYVMICLISGADKVPHLMKGMSFPLSVGPSLLPTADTRIVLDEYAFEISPALSAGRHSIRVENRGAQPHHVAIVRLAAGRSAQDALRWAATLEGPPPGESIGGTTAIAPGLANYVTADFTPGEYAFICFVPDPSDGRSHAHHGMIRQVRVP